jgi:hypothetical protein
VDGRSKRPYTIRETERFATRPPPITNADGPVDLRINAPDGSAVWLGGTRLDLAALRAVPLVKGENTLTLRVPATRGAGQEVTVEVQKTKDSPQRVDVVGGP